MTGPPQLPLTFPSQLRLRAEDFIPSPAHEEALAWINHWPQWPAYGLVLHGPAGSGKTHLAHIWAERAAARFLSASALLAPLQPLTSSLVVEGVETLAGTGEGEEALFHLLNHVKDVHQHILLTARHPPVLWPLQLKDVRSRVLALPSTHIPPPDDASLQAVLAKLFADRQVRVPAEVTRYLVKRMERSYTAAQTLVALLDEHALGEGRALTLPFVRAVLEKVSGKSVA